MTVKAIVNGAVGKMGKLIIKSIGETEGIELVGAVEKAGSEYLGKDAGTVAVGKSLDVLICDNIGDVVRGIPDGDPKVILDFSEARGTLRALSAAEEFNIPLVIGTTGIESISLLMGDIREAVKAIPIVMAPNMSVGVNLLFSLLPKIAKILGNEYDIEIIEAHHRFKKDAPSGTAVKMAQLLAEARGLDYETAARHGRKGLVGERPSDEIGIHAVRAGDIVGEHTVVFGGIGERIEITHRAHSRETFARGAVRAALWVARKPSGLYDMMDVLG
ncbi:4-hydroxy-tetrahydrodipicolinate reductase [Candidatus Falkowbacteria bacterium RBG_13_39_14]|uniref:4-hydroxy-tetrahydrodipicolinate reductase n=1 Tax=Candidatus Falkowbacteria bacterium RBG_13_39_14 TaxID=1797985 RepID=A0A1F5S1S5_9BACT|nr:MAG: 4-hydroxy-tetrahydrodipicolinate reductase [Candidatus Falkowbacteria bacterium RBG_13_39_14]